MSTFFTVLVWVFGVLAFFAIPIGLIVLWTHADLSIPACLGGTLLGVIAMAWLITLLINATDDSRVAGNSRHCGPGTTYTEYQHEDGATWICQVPR